MEGSGVEGGRGIGYALSEVVEIRIVLLRPLVVVLLLPTILHRPARLARAARAALLAGRFAARGALGLVVTPRTGPRTALLLLLLLLLFLHGAGHPIQPLRSARLPGAHQTGKRATGASNSGTGPARWARRAAAPPGPAEGRRF